MTRRELKDRLEGLVRQRATMQLVNRLLSVDDVAGMKHLGYNEIQISQLRPSGYDPKEIERLADRIHHLRKKMGERPGQ